MNFQPGDQIRLIGDVSAGKEGEVVFVDEDLDMAVVQFLDGTTNTVDIGRLEPIYPRQDPPQPHDDYQGSVPDDDEHQLQDKFGQTGKDGEAVTTVNPLFLEYPLREDVKNIDDIILPGPDHRGVGDTLRLTSHDSLLKAGYVFASLPNGEKLYKCPDCDGLYDSLQDAWHHFVTTDHHQLNPESRTEERLRDTVDYILSHEGFSHGDDWSMIDNRLLASGAALADAIEHTLSQVEGLNVTRETNSTMIVDREANGHEDDDIPGPDELESMADPNQQDYDEPNLVTGKIHDLPKYRHLAYGVDIVRGSSRFSKPHKSYWPHEGVNAQSKEADPKKGKWPGIKKNSKKPADTPTHTGGTYWPSERESGNVRQLEGRVLEGQPPRQVIDEAVALGLWSPKPLGLASSQRLAEDSPEDTAAQTKMFRKKRKK